MRLAQRLDPLGIGLVGLAVLSSLVVGRLATEPFALRIAIVVAALPFAVGLAFSAPRALLLTLVWWLAALGLTRRLISTSSGNSKLDLLLLVEPLALAALLLQASKQGAWRHLSPLAKGVLALTLLSVVGALNPLQGSVLGGLAGLLFVLVPMLAFWLGRALEDDRSLKLVLVTTGG